jgi:methyl coenzyme M reductase alpha subunit
MAAIAYCLVFQEAPCPVTGAVIMLPPHVTRILNGAVMARYSQVSNVMALIGPYALAKASINSLQAEA